MEPRNKLDQWLDHVLDEYGDVEPRLGLETRILASLAEQKTRAVKRTRWLWAFAGVAAGLAVVTMWVSMSTGRHRTPAGNLANNNTRSQQNNPALSTDSESQVRSSMAESSRNRSRPARGARLAKSPRLSQFPSARGLTTQEQLLARYAQKFPQQAFEIAQAQAAAEQERISAELAAE